MFQYIQDYFGKRKTKKVIHEFVSMLDLKDKSSLARTLISALSLRNDFLLNFNKDLFQINDIAKEEMEYRSNFFHEAMIALVATEDNFFSAGAHVWYITYLSEYASKYYKVPISSQEIWKRLNNIPKSEVLIYLDHLKKEFELITAELMKTDMKRALREMSLHNVIKLDINGFLTYPF